MLCTIDGHNPRIAIAENVIFKLLRALSLKLGDKPAHISEMASGIMGRRRIDFPARAPMMNGTGWVITEYNVNKVNDLIKFDILMYLVVLMLLPGSAVILAFALDLMKLILQ